MSLFGGEDLFNSGSHNFHIGGLSLRHVLNETPGSRGVQISSLGQHGRSIEQQGDLLADDPDKLRLLTDAIEMKLDGLSYTLVDHFNRSWLNTVMLVFDPSPEIRLGARIKVSYRIQYLQLVP